MKEEANMAKPKKGKNPTWTYIKEFDTFEEGYKELSTLIPNVRLYAVDSSTATLEEVVVALTKTITDSIPSPLNENYPNTFSFSISAREVGFLTDDFMAFGWRIFIGKDEETLAYQFRITFTTLSVSKRKQIDRLLSNGWKERDLSDKQSRFWNEVPGTQRVSHREGSEATNPHAKKPNVPKVLSKHETSIPDTFSKEMVEAKPTNEVVSPSPAVTTVSISEEGVENQPLSETDEFPMAEEPVQTVIAKPAVKVTEAVETSNIPCTIQPGSTPAVFIINHRGRQMVININDHNEGVYLDRSSYTFRIDNVLYNYQKFQVRYLDPNYQPEQAQKAINLGSDKMRQHDEVLSDEDFVGGKMVNERAAEVPEHVIIPPPKPKLPHVQQRQLDRQEMNANLIPPQQGGRLLNTGRAFVIDRTPKVPMDETVDGVADQKVRVVDNSFGAN